VNEREELLAGGNVAPVVRVGDTVRRTTGPWTPAVHQLLQYLEQAGFEYAPKVLGVDARGREILTYIEGETAGDDHPWAEWVWSDDALVQSARIMRAYHDAVRDFRPPGTHVWRFATAAIGCDDIVCHNDIAPYNIVWNHGRVVGVIDWDVASPAPRVFDVAHGAWMFAPIHAPEHSRELGAPLDVARRVRLFCDSYGLEDRVGFFDVVRERIEGTIYGFAVKAQAGEGAFVRMFADGHVDRMRDDLRELDAHRAEWDAVLVA
jgi:Phosphotransferase enzyme family